MKLARRIIAIAGAGIAGLTAALLLERLGFRVIVLERSKEFRQTGTGIQISPNAFKILDELGLGSRLLNVGFNPDTLEINSGLTGKHLRSYPLGRNCNERYGAPYVVVHRVDLMTVLEQACEDREDIEVRLDHRVTDMAAHSNGVTVLSEHRGKFEELRVSSVIGADGVWSETRRFVPEAATPEFTGKIAWRALLDIEDVPASIPRGSTGLWLGPDAHIVTYPIRQGRILNVVAITSWNRATKPPNGWVSETFMQDRVRAFQDWHPLLQVLIRKKSSWGGWPINSVQQLGAMCNGPLCLIGDAAHAMVPFAAQGGASSIEDAALLAQACAEHLDDLEKAFVNFGKARRKRINDLIKVAQTNQQTYHMKWPARIARDLVLSNLPEEQLMKKMDWVYNWEPNMPKKTSIDLSLFGKKGE